MRKYGVYKNVRINKLFHFTSHTVSICVGSASARLRSSTQTQSLSTAPVHSAKLGAALLVLRAALKGELAATRSVQTVCGRIRETVGRPPFAAAIGHRTASILRRLSPTDPGPNSIVHRRRTTAAAIVRAEAAAVPPLEALRRALALGGCSRRTLQFAATRQRVEPLQRIRTLLSLRRVRAFAAAGGQIQELRRRAVPLRDARARRLVVPGALRVAARAVEAERAVAVDRGVGPRCLSAELQRAESGPAMHRGPSPFARVLPAALDADVARSAAADQRVAARRRPTAPELEVAAPRPLDHCLSARAFAARHRAVEVSRANQRVLGALVAAAFDVARLSAVALALFTAPFALNQLRGHRLRSRCRGGFRSGSRRRDFCGSTEVAAEQCAGRRALGGERRRNVLGTVAVAEEAVCLRRGFDSDAGAIVAVDALESAVAGAAVEFAAVAGGGAIAKEVNVGRVVTGDLRFETGAVAEAVDGARKSRQTAQFGASALLGGAVAEDLTVPGLFAFAFAGVAIDDLGERKGCRPHETRDEQRRERGSHRLEDRE